MATNDHGSQGQPGIGVDSKGGAVIDPTRNVLDLVEAAVKRQDDLRAIEREWTVEVTALRAHHNAEVTAIRSDYDALLRKAESERINAIRAVDVGNVAAAASAAENRASALAAQVTESAETLRNQVAQAASASDTNLRSALEPIQKDIADLRRAQYEAQGQKTQVVETHASSASTGAWFSIGLAALFGFLMLSAAVTSIGVSVFIATR